MSLPDCIDVTLCMRLMQTLGHFIWQGISVFLLLWLATFLMRRSSSPVRYIVSFLALLLMVLCPAATFILLGQENTIPTVAPGPSLDVLVMPGSEITPTLVAEPPAIAETPALHVDWRQYAPSVAMGYLLGVVVMLCRLFLALQGGRRLRHQSEPVDDPRLLVALARQRRVLGLSFTPAIGYCRQVVVPTVIGVLRPMILLPISVSTGLSAEQIEALLAHELAHIRRYDHLVNILQRVIEAVLFFHPCVWLISRRVSMERENCCDDLVLAGGIEYVTYIDSLCKMAEIVLTLRSGHPLAAVAAVGAADRPSQLQQRIMRVIESPAHKPIRLASGPTFALILMGLATTLAVFQLSASGSPERAGDLTTKPIIDGNVYILGQVKRPGAYTISEGQKLTLTKLLDVAGGYSGEKIESASIVLSMYGGDGKRHITRKLGLNTLSEEEGGNVFLRDGDFVTLSSETLYRPQYSVKLVVGKDRMTFQGQHVTWDNLPALLQAIPNRPYTVICIAMAKDNIPTTEQYNTAQRKVDELVNEYGFEERGLSESAPLGTPTTTTHYVPIESMHYAFGKAIPVDDSLLLTHTNDPPGRPRYAIRLVIGADRMTLQGRDVNWQQLPDLLNAVPDRDQTIFEIAIASDSPPGDKFLDAEARAGELQKRFGFKWLHKVRPQPLGAMGSLTRYVTSKGTNRIPQ